MLVRVVGMHCESGDIIVHEDRLPADLRRGDILAVPVTAHTAARWRATTIRR